MLLAVLFSFLKKNQGGKEPFGGGLHSPSAFLVPISKTNCNFGIPQCPLT